MLAGLNPPVWPEVNAPPEADGPTYKRIDFGFLGELGVVLFLMVTFDCLEGVWFKFGL